MRKTAPLLLVVSTAAALVLAGCSSPSHGSTAAGSSCTPQASGSVSDSVKVTGAYRQTPKVTFSKPLKASSLERTVVDQGKGQTVKSGDTVNIGLAAYDGTTGKRLSVGGFGSGSETLPLQDTDATLPGLVAAVHCTPIGSRTVVTGAATTAWGSGDPTSYGLKKTDSVVFVVDLVGLVPNKATGTPEPPQPGFPTVKLAPSGKPTVTIPSGLTPPTTTQIEALKKGSGAVVKSGDTVTVQYQGTIWRTGKVFDQSWGKAAVPLQTTEVVPGFSKALVGQTVGSQVLAVIPPADGYGSSGLSQAGIKGTDTLVFVVDILKTQQ